MPYLPRVKRSDFRAVLLAGAACTFVGQAAFGIAYQGTDLYPIVPPSGYTSISAGPYQFTEGGQTFLTVEDQQSGNNLGILYNADGTTTDLRNASIDSVSPYGVRDGYQVGGATGSGTNDETHAYIWHGSADSGFDLQPTSGYLTTLAYAIGGGQEVGYGLTPSYGTDALLWNGESNVATDLNPSFANYGSIGEGAGGMKQVGLTYVGASNSQHATVWSGTADTAVDLNPSVAFSSDARGTDGLNEVGFVSVTVDTSVAIHAALWSGSADTFLDLNPTQDGFTFSQANDVSNGIEVGYGSTDSENTALLWLGSSLDYVDLGALLPAGFTDSQAISIDSLGNVYGVAYGTDGYEHAVEWSVVPEPASLALLICGGIFSLGRRRTRQFPQS